MAMMAMESTTRPLYGGMVELLVPQSMTDVSDHRARAGPPGGL